MKKKEGRKFKIVNKEILESLVKQNLSVRRIMEAYNRWIDENYLDNSSKISYYFVWKFKKSLKSTVI